jgi:hypothetical protein
MKRRLTKANIKELAKEMPVLSIEEQREIIGGVSITIDVTRYGEGTNTTVSTFTATLTRDNGTTASISGYMLEPRTDSDQCDVAGSDTAICPGSFSLYKRSDGKYELIGVPGRSYIQIHKGSTGDDTTGCLLVGNGVSYNNGDYSVSGTTTIFTTLSALLDEALDNGGTAEINVGTQSTNEYGYGYGEYGYGYGESWY